MIIKTKKIKNFKMFLVVKNRTIFCMRPKIHLKCQLKGINHLRLFDYSPKNQ